MTLGFILKRARRDWRQLGTLTVAICLVTGFLALAPLYVRAMVQSGLQYELDQISPARLELTLISPSPFEPPAWELVNQELGPLTAGLTRIARSGTAFGGFAYLYGEPTFELSPRSPFGHHAYAFSNLRDILRLVAGRWPQRLPPPDSPERQVADEEERKARGLGMYSKGDVEAVIGAEVARQTGYEIGARFAIGERPADRVVVHVVGIVEAVDPDDPIWETNRRALEGERIQTGLVTSAYNLAFIVTEGAYSDWVAKAARLRSSENNSYLWLVKLNGGAVNADNLGAMRDGMTALVNRLTADYPGLISFNPLLRLLNNYVGLVSRTEGPIMLLSGAVLVLMLYHLVATANLTLERQREEWASMSSRGASLFQLVRLQGFTMLLLCLVGFGAGPALAVVILQGLLYGGPLAAPTGGVVPIAGIPPGAFLLSGLAALAALVMLILPAIPAAWRSLAQFKQLASRPPARPVWARFGLDLILIITGLGFIARLLFFVEGDLGGTLTLLFTDPAALIQVVIDGANRTGGLGDPLNLAGPALLLTGVALLWLRLFPALMRVLGIPIRRGEGLAGPLSVWNVERDPGHYAQLVLLLIGTLALGTAALALGETRDNGAWAAAQHETGGAARIDLDPLAGPPDRVAWTGLPGVADAAIVTRYESVYRAGYTQTFLVGVDPAALIETFPATQAAAAPLIGETATTRSGFDRARRRFTTTTVFPAVISARMAEDEGRAFRSDRMPLEVGDEAQVDLLLPGNMTVTLHYRVVGITRGFPTLAENQHFLVMDAGILAAAINTTQGLAPEAQALPDQVWLVLPARAPSPELEAAIRQLPGLRAATYAWDRYNLLLREPLPAAVAGMLYAGFWVSLLLSLLDFGFYLAVTARQRSLGFAVLQALGWNINRIWAQLMVEHGILVIPALLVGLALGAALGYVILPFLALVGGVPLALPVADLIALLAVLLAGFGLLSFGAAWWLRRLNINQVLRLGEE